VSEPSVLDRLCAHYGIAASYQDAHGRERRPPDASRRALLRAMGAEVGDEAVEQESLRAALDREWLRVLPPVQVLWEDAESLRLSLTLPTSGQDGPLHWMLTTEQGEVTGGSLDLGSLPQAEERRIAGQSWVLRRVALPAPRGHGYHRLELFGGEQTTPLAAQTVILAPRRCYLPEGVSGERRAWGLSTQLHALRSSRNWGIGDFTDLTRLVELTAEAGAGAVALNPLHALFPSRPEVCNPYSPSSRMRLNLLHIDVEALPDLAECEPMQQKVAGETFQALLRAARSASLVDYAAVAKAKLTVLEGLYRHFREQHLSRGSARAQDFLAFCEAEGESLRRFALFEALSEHHCAAAGGPLALGDWPEPYRQAGSQAVAAFAAEHGERIDFHAWLQWQAERQLQAVGKRSLELGLALGLCQDLAIGASPEGADVWADTASYIQGAHIGAPPDAFSPKGQNWGVLAWHPLVLRALGYAPFAQALRANMREAGALRIDHVMGLMRLFLIPEGAPPTAGAYLSYPFEELLGVLALESVRNRCLVIGEDLGTVPDALRTGLAPLGVLSFRLLYFERDARAGFQAPSELEPQAVVAASTHDLPTLAGFWQGRDLEQRRELGLFAEEREYEEQLLARTSDRARLFLALEHAGLLPAESAADPVAVPELTPAHLCAIQVYLARAPSKLLLIQTADLLGEAEQVNLPGSGDAYPNWRRRHPLELEAWPEQPQILALLAAVRAERGSAARTAPRPEPHATPSRALIPRATYRLQLHAGFGFAAAAELVPYLAELGISHCYFSPYLKARPGSTHGYDVVAHDRLNPELGTADDYEHLYRNLAAHGMAQILDMVPNHVGVMGQENGWWLDVLENGRASPYASYFDIDWEPLRQELRGKVLVPVLGDYYGNVLDSGALRLVFAEGAFRAEYYEHHFPIDPREYPRILAPGLERLRKRLGESDEQLAAFESLVTAFGNLPPRWSIDEAALNERRRDKELHKRRLAELTAGNADLNWYVHECLRELNGDEHYTADTGRLHALLEAQAYRLAHWRVAADEINYRRFFDINDLAALRMENREAFEATHALVLELIAQGRLAGLRIDHPDGLHDPAQYFRWVQEQVGALAARAPDQAIADERPLYLVVEKILAENEQLPPSWPVHGTTGYDFAALADALLVDPRGADPLSRCYQDFAGEVRPLADEVYATKRLVMRNMLSSELHVLASELSRIAESDPHTRDYTLDALRDALAEVVACFPVYRTYVSAEGVLKRDRHQVLKAVSEARRRSRAPDHTVFGFVQDVLATDIAEGKSQEYRARVLRLAMKFQQYTGPVTAKGVEDTAFYRYHRLVSLNEVGGEPGRFGLSIAAFHRANEQRHRDWPHGLLAGSTHDSKRSEDVRARLHVLSELPGEWREHVERWALLNRRFRREVDGGNVPDPNTEYLLYQTLLGAWPLEPLDEEALSAFRQRIRDYMEKAVKEAKVHTAWTNTAAEYEGALAAFVDAALDPERNRPFFDDFLPFQRRVARLGLFNSLSLTLLRLTAPGVPDLYQGTELWTYSLVDPDNRRPVDFERRRTLLGELGAALDAAPARAGLLGELLAHLEDGRAKLYLIREALRLRREHPALFEQGDYTALDVQGPRAEHLCAYARRHGGRSVVALAPRLLAGLVPADSEAGDPFAAPAWSSTFVTVPGPALRDLLSGADLSATHSRGRHILPAGEVLRGFPVGLLTCEDPRHA
jgi:(1->4)-alpha-D-glucan 1-alpha-D-glucosylmutase